MHYAAIVSSSFLYFRPSIGQSSSANVVVRVAARSITSAVAKTHHNVGKCCCRKGKCRETPRLPWDNDKDHVEQAIHTFEYAPEARTMVFHPYGSLRRVRRVFSNTLTHCNTFRTSPCFTMFSRSVASTASIPKRQATTLSSQPLGAQGTRLKKFRDKNDPRSQRDIRSLWEAFSALQKEGEIDLLETRELFGLCGMIVDGEHGQIMGDDTLTQSLSWGRRLESVVAILKERIPSYSSEDLRIEYIEVAVLSLQGHCEDAAAVLARILSNTQNSSPHVDHSRWAQGAFRHVLMSLLRHNSASQAIEFYLDNKMALQRALDFNPMDRRSLTRYGGPLFRELSAIFKAIDSPATFLSDKKDTWIKARISSLGRTMIHLLCQDRLAEDALEVYEELRRQDIQVFYYLEHALIRALSRAERFQSANLLYAATMPNNPDRNEARSYDSTGLFLFAHQGDVGRAEKCFGRLLALKNVLPQELTLVMHASAVRGDVERVVTLFEDFFVKKVLRSEHSIPYKPNKFHYTTVIHAHSIRDDFDGLNIWLERMLADGHTPDIATYNSVLKAVASRDDARAIYSLLDQMRTMRIPPNVSSYTTVISILARRRDILGAEALFKRMTRERIVPDRIAVTALMNAHVEAGSWKGVIRVFDYIRGSQLKEIRLGVEVFNTLLKAYVLIGAPFEVVTDIFRRLEASNIRPTNRTFALLIQSACFSNHMGFAAKLFAEMETLGNDWTTDVEVTKEVLTIIMAAYLRQGNKHQARIVFEDMQKRGLQPTAYTFASILRSYSNHEFEDNVRIGQEFLDSLVSQPPEEQTWRVTTSGRESSLSFIYAPLLNAHAKMLNVESVENVYADFIDKGKRPTIGTLALLLDVYRRTDNIEGVHRIWPQILEIALARTDEVDKLLHPSDSESEFFRSRRRTDLLCIPLSIYVDALSRAGQHIEIAHTWNDLREAGFQFDSHNWNHLAVALVRAGQPVRAFEVVEKVILPYQSQSHSIIRSRPKKVDSPLLFDDEDARAEIVDEPFIAKGKRSAERLAADMERIRDRFTGNKDRDGPTDFAHELQVLQMISPEWNVWRPHFLTLQTLARVLEHLDTGRLVHPTKPNLTESSDAKVLDVDAEWKEAQEMLSQILRDYPRAVQRVDKWESAVKLSEKKVNNRYVWESKDEVQRMQSNNKKSSKYTSVS